MALKSWQPLASADRSSLWAEFGGVSMTIQMLVLFDHVVTLDYIRNVFDERLHLAPQLMRKPVSLIPGITKPGWVQVQDFDPMQLVTETQVGPGDPWQEIGKLAAKGAESTLPRDRPLWALNLIQGLDGGNKSAILMSFHHALLDGSAVLSVALLGVDGLDPSQMPVPPAMPRYRRRDHLAHLLGSKKNAEPDPEQEESAPTVDPERISLSELAKGLAKLRRSAPMTALNKRHGRGREVAFVQIPEKRIKRASRRRSCTQNDIVLAAVTGALHDLLSLTGQVPEQDPVALMPIARSAAKAKKSADGNTFSTVIVPLPFGLEDDQELATTIGARTFEVLRSRKGGGKEAALLMKVTGVGSPLVGAFTARMVSRMRAFNVVVSNVTGPPMKLSSFGGEVNAAVGIIPLNPANQGLNVFVNSYARTMYFSIVAAKNLPFTAEQIADAVRARLERLTTFEESAVGQAPAAGQSDDEAAEAPAQ